MVGDDSLADVVVIGGGLAGCEAAWQISERGLSVDLYEMRPYCHNRRPHWREIWPSWSAPIH